MKTLTYRLKVLLIASVCSGLAPALARAQARTVTLAALEEKALATRQNMVAQQARMRRAAAEVDRRRTASRPIVTLAGDVSLSPGGTLEHVAAADLDPTHEILVQGVPDIADRNAFAPQARYGATVDITKSLYDFGRASLAIEAARAEEAAAGADDRALRRQVVDDVRAAYLAWLSATEVAAISGQAVADAQARVKRVTDLVADGSKPAADIAPVASEEALARLDLARSRAEVENTRLMLDAAVGGGLPGDAEPDRAVLRPLAPAPAGDCTDSGADAAAEALGREGEAARATAAMYDRMHAPVVGADAQLGLRAQNPIAGSGSSGVFPVFRVAVSVTVPLWDGGSASANAGVARAQADELAARSRELTLAGETARTRARADEAAAAERLGIARELLAISDTRVREAEERYVEAGGRVEAIADANAMLRRANTEIVMAEIAAARARFAADGQ